MAKLAAEGATIMTADLKLPQLAVLGSTMAYREAAQPGAPLALFLHGNPTSSYIWRNVIPHVAPVARCIAPDLIGFGQSGKPDIAYRFEDHVRYLDAFLDAAGISSAYIVGQDWGASLALHLAARRPQLVRGLAFMEPVRPARDWEDFHSVPAARELFQKLRTPGVGEQLILHDNVFVEGLARTVVRKLTAEEMAAYRAPFPTSQSRLPVWRLPNEIPVSGQPADVNAALEQALQALRASAYPKLLFAAEPGATMTPAYAAELAASLQNCRLVKLGAGVHNLQEDHPDVIGRCIADWIRETH
jgi:haloalkane dehalogenase